MSYTKPTCLFVGFGQIASRVFEDLSSEIESLVLKRTAREVLPSAVREIFIGDVADQEAWCSLPDNIDVILYCVTPSGRSAEAYDRVFVRGLEQCVRRFVGSSSPHIVFVSSSSVFSQDNGEIVDELSAAMPSSPTATVIRQAERILEQSNLAHTVVRFSGIYGAERLRMVRQVLAREPVLSGSERLSNRIHEDDAVGFLVFLIQKVLARQDVEALYIASDSAPVDLNEVYRFIARQLGIDATFIEAGAEPVRRTGNKRLSNKRMLNTGYGLQYPDYRQGYAEMCARISG
jgi:nucleoside-diphosphate-sugar epimerase